MADHRMQFDGWVWPHPERVSELEWTLRYGQPTRENLLEAAGMLNALFYLTSPTMTSPRQAQRKLAKIRHRVIAPEATATTTSEPASGPGGEG